MVGVPDERRGEELCAWIKYREGVPEQSHEELQEFCKQKVITSFFKSFFL